jgi:hypothetical protein
VKKKIIIQDLKIPFTYKKNISSTGGKDQSKQSTPPSLRKQRNECFSSGTSLIDCGRLDYIDENFNA